MDRLFSATYSDARANFLQACLQAKVSVSHHMHSLKGPSGEVLATDVARIGPDDAPDVVVVVSATHGAEGYAGSGIQIGLLETMPGKRNRACMLLSRDGPRLGSSHDYLDFTAGARV